MSKQRKENQEEESRRQKGKKIVLVLLQIIAVIATRTQCGGGTSFVKKCIKKFGWFFLGVAKTD